MQVDINKFYGFIVQYGLNLAAGICIFIVGRWLSKIISEIVERSMNRARFHRTLALFFKHLVFYGLFTFTIIAVLNKLGVETSSFIAVVGAASLAIGLALQGSLSNFAAGVMIILLSPFEVGDTIDLGAGGTPGLVGLVEEIQIFNTILITADKKRIIVPNAKITGNLIIVLPRDMPSKLN